MVDLARPPGGRMSAGISILKKLDWIFDSWRINSYFDIEPVAFLWWWSWCDPIIAAVVIPAEKFVHQRPDRLCHKQTCISYAFPVLRLVEICFLDYSECLRAWNIVVSQPAAPIRGLQFKGDPIGNRSKICPFSLYPPIIFVLVRWWWLKPELTDFATS